MLCRLWVLSGLCVALLPLLSLTSSLSLPFLDSLSPLDVLSSYELSLSVSRIDYACQWLLAIFTAPIQIIVCTVLLIIQIGWSALIGISLFILLIPIQSRIMGYSITIRKKSMVYTDARSRTLQELLSSFAILKYFVFERAYLRRIADIRGKELIGVWRISLVKAANQGRR